MTAVAVLLIVLVTLRPLGLPWVLRRGVLVDMFPAPTDINGSQSYEFNEDRIRFRLPPSTGEQIDAAARGRESQAVAHDRLRDRVVGLIERHPDRGAEVIRAWLHHG